MITPASFFHLGHFQHCHCPSQMTTGRPSPHGQDLNLPKSCTARRISRRVLSINSSKSGLQHSSHTTTSLPLPTTMTSTRVRNMGNFNLFQTHVLMFFRHVEQCCYPSFLIIPHIPAMTSHVAYVIYATFTLIMTQGLCNITFFLCLSLFFYAFGTVFSYVHYLFPLFSYPCRLTHSM